MLEFAQITCGDEHRQIDQTVLLELILPRDQVPAQLMFVTYICQARSNSDMFSMLVSYHSAPATWCRVLSPTGDKSTASVPVVRKN